MLLRLLFIVTALLPTLSLAQNVGPAASELPWYQIELFIYGNNDPGARDNEQWQTYPQLHYRADSAQLLPLNTGPPRLPAVLQQQTLSSPTITSQLEEQPLIAFQLLPTRDGELRDSVRRISRQADFRTLFHGVWRQPLEGRDSAKTIVINGGDRFGNHFELEGTVTLAVNRYLHIETDLWLSSFINSGGLETLSHLRLPPSPRAATAQHSTIAATEERMDQQYAIEHIALMRQKRRMRSGELHYIDHPSMAILIKITPYEPLEADTEQVDIAATSLTTQQ